jgi:hypothetical protein
MLAKVGIRSDYQNGGRLFVVLPLCERLHGDSFVIKEDFLRFIETISD